MKTLTITREQVGIGKLILINRQNATREHSVNLNLVTGGSEDIFLEKEAANVLDRLLDQLNATTEIVPVSGFRSRNCQETLFRESLLEHGEAYTNQFVAYPGCSEHESGLAIDLSLGETAIDRICPSFPYYGIAQYFREAAPYFGYVERYGKDKQDITGIGHEPWHFRYVGYPHSLIMKEQNYCLEEYIAFLRKNHGEQNPYHYSAYKDQFRIYYQKMDSDVVLPIREDEIVSVSGDNIDGCIVTIAGGCYED